MRAKRLLERASSLLRKGQDTEFIRNKGVPPKMREDRVTRFMARLEAKDKAKRRR